MGSGKLDIIVNSNPLLELTFSNGKFIAVAIDFLEEFDKTIDRKRLKIILPRDIVPTEKFLELDFNCISSNQTTVCVSIW